MYTDSFEAESSTTGKLVNLKIACEDSILIGGRIMYGNKE